MKERLIIIFVAIIAGLFITTAGFFIYQSTKDQNDTPIEKKASTVTPQPNQDKAGGIFVRVAEPNDESLTTKRTLVIKGSTNPENLIVVSTNIEDVQAKPTQEGNFSVSIDIDAGANPVITRAIAPDGSWTQDIRTITYSTEEF
ncbi:MAG: hypothetical protein Q7T54_04145 [Candidatus Levybacteria bacterium]|nr:hypothetical protein [Candidatus Levybacteria bacterium]